MAVSLLAVSIVLPTVDQYSTAGHTQAIDLTGAKLNDLDEGDGGNVLRLNGREKFCQSSKSQMHDCRSTSTVVNNDVTNNPRIWNTSGYFR